MSKGLLFSGQSAYNLVSKCKLLINARMTGLRYVTGGR